MSSLEEIHLKLSEYKKRFRKKQAIGGLLIFLVSNISLFLFLALLEHQLWMSSTARTVVLFLFLGFLVSGFIYLIIRPLVNYFAVNQHIDNKKAAKEISKFFPEVEDRLINLLELGKQNTSHNSLIGAAIDKKALTLRQVQFSQAVDFKVVKKYSGLFGLTIIAFFLVSFINPDIINESPARIANFSKHYEKESPFRFSLINKDLSAFKGEDYELSFTIEGDAIPNNVSLSVDGIGKYPSLDESGVYVYTFQKIQASKTFHIEANGFRSNDFKIQTFTRPDLLAMTITVREPVYTGGESRVISNTGDLTIKEGSDVSWDITTLATNESQIYFQSDSSLFGRTEEDRFLHERRILDSENYQIVLKNRYSSNKSQLSYSIEVKKDEYPKIRTDYFPDSISFQYITLAGSITDDYGFSGLRINYRKSNSEYFSQIPLEINTSSLSQSFYATWQLDSLHLSSGDRLEVYVSVSDNDQINGSKTVKSNPFIFQIPTSDEFDEMLSEKSDEVENELSDAKKSTEEIADRLSQIEDRLKTEQKFDWQEKKLLEDIIEDREKLNQQLSDLQKKHNELKSSSKQFKNQSSQLQEQNEKLQELMKQLMDEETLKLYEKLKELMKQNSPKDEISEQLQKLKRNEQNLERDMKRALELFKRLKMESQLEENLQKLDTLSSEQEKAASNEKLDESEKLQDQINEEFEDFRKQMDEVMEMNQELKRPEALDDFEYEERQIAKELKEIEEMMKEAAEQQNNEGQNDENEENNGEEQSQQKQNGKSKNTQQKQKNAAQKMKSLSKKLSTMQGGMQMEMMQANLDQLRDILDNLIKLSFNQEEIMTEMRQVSQSDPRFLELSQNQLKLKDDAEVIQDSLIALANRVVQISSFVTREVDQINLSVNKTLDYLKERNRGRALTEQQFAMTSINNLALLLDDTMQQMQMAMSEAMGSGSDQKQEQQGLPDMQELQNQLGQKINELKGSGKSGRELSEELARLAAEQEMIRQQLELLKQAEEGRPGGKGAGDELQKAIDMMEENEIDLVNKRLTEQLIFRQNEIKTRLLEADKAKREQETEEEREAESPSMITRDVPPEFEEYLNIKRKEIELLKTIPIELNPFYKKEVNDYFRRISSEEPE